MHIYRERRYWDALDFKGAISYSSQVGQLLLWTAASMNIPYHHLRRQRQKARGYTEVYFALPIELNSSQVHRILLLNVVIITITYYFQHR